MQSSDYDDDSFRYHSIGADTYSSNMDLLSAAAGCSVLVNPSTERQQHFAARRQTTLSHMMTIPSQQQQGNLSTHIGDLFAIAVTLLMLLLRAAALVLQTGSMLFTWCLQTILHGIVLYRHAQQLYTAASFSFISKQQHRKQQHGGRSNSTVVIHEQDF